MSAWAAQVTEEQLAGAFQDCGRVVDCRMCGDPNSAMRFAFIEFYQEDSVQKVWPMSLLAWDWLRGSQLWHVLEKWVRVYFGCNMKFSLHNTCSAVSARPDKAWCWQAIATMNGARVGAYPLRVLPSKTAIVPVNNHFLPRTPEERELCGRTVYVANIDKKVDKQHVLAFFEKHCGACMCALSTQTTVLMPWAAWQPVALTYGSAFAGPVSRIRLLGDHHHQTRIAFVEFHEANHAKEALDCSGALLGALCGCALPLSMHFCPCNRSDGLLTYRLIAAARVPVKGTRAR